MASRVVRREPIARGPPAEKGRAAADRASRAVQKARCRASTHPVFRRTHRELHGVELAESLHGLHHLWRGEGGEGAARGQSTDARGGRGRSERERAEKDDSADGLSENGDDGCARRGVREPPGGRSARPPAAATRPPDVGAARAALRARVARSPRSPRPSEAIDRPSHGRHSVAPGGASPLKKAAKQQRRTVVALGLLGQLGRVNEPLALAEGAVGHARGNDASDVSSRVAPRGGVVAAATEDFERRANDAEKIQQRSDGMQIVMTHYYYGVFISFLC